MKISTYILIKKTYYNMFLIKYIISDVLNSKQLPQSNTVRFSMCHYWRWQRALAQPPYSLWDFPTLCVWHMQSCLNQHQLLTDRHAQPIVFFFYCCDSYTLQCGCSWLLTALMYIQLPLAIVWRSCFLIGYFGNRWSLWTS